MADSNEVLYGMGQLLYNANTSYITNLNGVCNKNISQEGYEDYFYYLGNNKFFSKDWTYYLRLNIPQNKYFNLIFDIRLVKYNSNNMGSPINYSKFQEIKRIVVPKFKKELTSYDDVILFPVDVDGIPTNNLNSAKSTKVAILRSADKAEVGDAYIKTIGEKETYQFKFSDNDEYKILYKNDQKMLHTWLADENSGGVISYEMVFSLKAEVSDFNAVLIKMYRQDGNQDDFLEYEDGKEIRGIRLDIDNNVLLAESDSSNLPLLAECYTMTNLISSNPSSYSSIGVWSHPNTIMAINGEEIRVGQSGYYELNNFNITNFGIVVDPSDYNSAKKRFSVDYQYIVNNG